MTEQDDLARLAELTAAIKTNLSRNEELSAERRQVALRLRDAGITYKSMAETAGISEVYVYKILRGPAAVKKQEKATAKARRKRQGGGA